MYGLARKVILGLVLATSMLFAVGSAHAAPVCVPGATTTTCTFSYTGAPEAWVVPAGVTSAVFDVYGAQGGSFAGSGRLPAGSGGKGGHVQATVALTPGATLNMRVGGKGADGVESPNPFSGTLTAQGGFNGGGTNTVTCSGCAFVLGGAGGGSTDVRTSADGLVDRVLAAGGGGGAGVGAPPSDPGTGGDSATTAKSVTDNSGPPFGGGTCTGGGGGTLVAPGAGGGGAGCTPGSAGAAGGLNGGNAGAGVGAGGGGYFGGGSGAFGLFMFFIGSGGGGGSNYPDPASPPAGITNVTVTNGVQSGNGLLTVTFATPTAVMLASASATRSAKGVVVRWRTGTEVDLLGFQVFRSSSPAWRRMGGSAIAAKGSVSGASYRFLDRTARRGVHYRYRIKAVQQDGTASWFGPVRVT